MEQGKRWFKQCWFEHISSGWRQPGTNRQGWRQFACVPLLHAGPLDVVGEKCIIAACGMLFNHVQRQSLVGPFVPAAFSWRLCFVFPACVSVTFAWQTCLLLGNLFTPQLVSASVPWNMGRPALMANCGLTSRDGYFSKYSAIPNLQSFVGCCRDGAAPAFVPVRSWEVPPVWLPGLSWSSHRARYGTPKWAEASGKKQREAGAPVVSRCRVLQLDPRSKGGRIFESVTLKQGHCE